MYKRSWRRLIKNFTEHVNSVFSEGRPMMRPTISAIQVRPQYHHLNCIVHNVIVGSSEVPILWSPKLYTELGRGGCKHISHPHLTFVRVVTCKVVLSFTQSVVRHSSVLRYMIGQAAHKCGLAQVMHLSFVSRTSTCVLTSSPQASH